MIVNEIVYGNPRQSHLVYLNEIAYADKFYDKLVTLTPPLNSSKATREELNELVTRIDVLAKQPEILKQFKQYDYNLFRFFQHVFKVNNLDEGADKVMIDILADINPLVYKLKFKFNRPRPHQLAQAYKLKLWPYKSHSDDSPSFPSAHTVAANVICYVFGNYYPELFKYFDDLAGDITESRMYLGLNYQSDIDQGLLIAEMIKSDKEFNNKYRL